jgi:hypothetical protein
MESGQDTYENFCSTSDQLETVVIWTIVNATM